MSYDAIRVVVYAVILLKETDSWRDGLVVKDVTHQAALSDV